MAASAAGAGQRLGEQYQDAVAAWAEDPTPQVVAVLADVLEEQRALSVLERTLPPLDREWVAAEPEAALALAHLLGLTKVALIQRWEPGYTPGGDRDSQAQVVRFLNRRLARLLGTTEPWGDVESARVWTTVAYLALLLPNEGLAGASGMFREALDRDPTSLAALLGEGYLAERNADFVVAEARLARVLELVPEHAEARLRWALVQARRGQHEEAVASLETLLETPTPPWIRRLVFQELARELRVDAPAKAEALLTQALEEFPRDQRLRLQHAHQTQQRWAEATRAMVDLAAAWEPPREPSPRLRYDYGPLDDRTQLLQTVERDLSRQREALRRALATVAAETRR